ncbi:MAG: hypothetical protein H6712_25775 [Myxococcales bacterium]|nr:hypothetical protein [Myxococcales bacterium]
MTEDLERLSGGALRAASRGDAHVLARPYGEPGAYGVSMTIEHHDRTEHRELSASDCGTLARAVVLVTAATLAPLPTNAALSHPSPPRVPAVRPDALASSPALESPPLVRADPAPATTEPRAPRRRDRVLLGAFVGPAFAIVPGPSPMLGGDIGWGRGPWSIHAVGWHALASTQQLERGVGVRASLSAGGVHVRYSLATGPVAIPLGVGIEAGALVGGGTGDSVAGRDAVAPWVAASVGAGAAWPAQSRIALQLCADAVVPLARSGIHLTRDGVHVEAFRTPSVGARVLVGARLRLP